jgi:osmotically-inducible protein OsmY
MTLVEAQPAVCCQVEAAIQSRCGWQIRDLRVEASNHFVVLRGWATTYYAKQLAQHAATAVTGLAVLENRIVVR